MGLTKEQLLARLQELQIVFSQYEHPVVLTVEAQDKKQRFYIVSALAETKVDLKVLSQRLGLGKGGLRMAPEEALAEILQVPLGCVTPFALVNDSARNVSLLLDQGFKSQECCFFHPLSNDMSIVPEFYWENPAYVDLEANPTVGKDQPPDLANLVPSDAAVLAVPVEKQGSSQAIKPSNASSTKEKSSGAASSSISYADTDKFVEEILEKTKSIVLSEIKEENAEKYQEQLANLVSNNISKLGVELKNIATIFKNTAYTEGFKAGIHHQPKRM
ncbi:hypothetical protein DH2020_007107 [Rehmannia glutinosa]|uniref:YbaK/aminoacyl-tRNA synthetase-associated domain-containing protein n=1 Tax=Rehmannia glutinosa TaxID=99300 RepID=A0ABR0TX70_REHGL